MSAKELRSFAKVTGVKPNKVATLVHSIIMEHEENSNDFDFIEEVRMIVQSGITETLLYKLGSGGHLSITLTSFALGRGNYDVEVQRKY